MSPPLQKCLQPNLLVRWGDRQDNVHRYRIKFAELDRFVDFLKSGRRDRNCVFAGLSRHEADRPVFSRDLREMRVLASEINLWARNGCARDVTNGYAEAGITCCSQFLIASQNQKDCKQRASRDNQHDHGILNIVNIKCKVQ
jgi:hypothetical protein